MNTSSAFLALPLEIRQQIYGFCIPQNLRFNYLFDLYHQNRPRGWIEPPWRTGNGLDGTCLSSEEEQTDCYICGSETTKASLTDTVGDDEEDGESRYWPSGLGDDDDDNDNDDDDEDEYEMSVLSGKRDKYFPYGPEDYCHMCQRYRPGVPVSRQSALPGILLVCRQMTEEVEAMLYGGNIFTIDVHGDGQSDLAKVSPERREKMRKIIVVLRPMGVSYRPAFRMDPEIWDGVLRNVGTLGVVAEQPERLTPYSWPRREWEEVFEEWEAWLTPILKYLGRVLPSTAQVVVDADKEEDTVQIVEKVMPGRCSFQRLRAADFIFRRGEYSMGSGYWDDDGPTSCRDIINDCDYDHYYSD